MDHSGIASVTVGINRYFNEYYRRPGSTLRYAASDARAFHAYLSDAWPAAKGATHKILVDEAATQSAIEAAFVELARREPYESLFIYLAGHGDKDSNDEGWFCTFDAQPNKPGIDASVIDRLLSQITAQQVILVIDCCYAESIVRSSLFFRELRNSRAKLFLCSARQDQLTFEDAGWGHGALSFLLLNALSPDSPLQKVNGAISVQGTLFPYLCEQLPLLVFRQKSGKRQEPLMGALGTISVWLSVAKTGVRKANTSVFEVVRARYRQFLGATLLLAVVALALSQLLLYHFAIGVDGFIQVRRGIAPFYWATIPGHRLHVETSISQTDITVLNAEAASQLRSGTVWGVWTQRSESGLRMWLDKLEPFLSAPAAERLSLITGRGVPENAIARDRFSGVQWRPDTVADAVLLTPVLGQRLSERYLSTLPSLSEQHCEKSIANSLDFSLLQMSNEDVRFYLATLGDYLQSETKLAPELVNSAVKLVSYRAFHMTNRLEGAEFETAVSEYRDLMKLVRQAAASNLAIPTTAQEGWCEPAHLARAGLAADEAQLEIVVHRLLVLVDPTRSTSGDLLSFKQIAALESLKAIAMKRHLPDEATRGVYNFLQSEGAGLEGNPGLVQWLRQVAELQALPSDVVSALEKDVESPSTSNSLIPLRSFDLLARQARYLSEDQRAFLVAHAADVTRDYAGTEQLSTTLGYLGCTGLYTQEAISYLSPRIHEDQIVRPNKQTVVGFTIIQAGDDFSDGMALGRIAQGRVSDSGLIKRLETFAANRLGSVDPSPIVRALAAQRQNGRTPNQVLRDIVRLLDRSRTSARRREVAVDVATEELLLLPPQSRQGAIELARAAWLAEREPDLKIGWASIVLMTLKESATFDSRPCL